VSLNDEDSQTVKVITDTDGNVVLACDDPDAEPFGPGHALLGTVTDAGEGVVKRWDDPITENPAVGATEGVGDVQHAARPPELPLTLSAAFARLDRRPLFVSAPARTEFQALQFMPALVARSFCCAVCSSAATTWPACCTPSPGRCLHPRVRRPGAGHQPEQPRRRYGRRRRLHRRRHDRRASGAKNLLDPRALDVDDPGE
jgi:hypothetical protein